MLQIHSPRKKLAHLDENFKAESDYDGAATVKSPRSGSRKSAHVLATLDAGQQETNNNSSSASRSLLRTLSANTLISAPGVDSKTTTVVSKQLKSSLAVAAGKQKSPRRTLLTKRVLDVQRQTCSTLTTVAAGPRQALAKRSGYGASSSGSLPKPVCRCFGQPTVCNVCLAR